MNLYSIYPGGDYLALYDSSQKENTSINLTLKVMVTGREEINPNWQNQEKLRTLKKLLTRSGQDTLGILWLLFKKSENYSVPIKINVNITYSIYFWLDLRLISKSWTDKYITGSLFTYDSVGLNCENITKIRVFKFS